MADHPPRAPFQGNPDVKMANQIMRDLGKLPAPKSGIAPARDSDEYDTVNDRIYAPVFDVRENIDQIKPAAERTSRESSWDRISAASLDRIPAAAKADEGVRKPGGLLKRSFTLGKRGLKSLASGVKETVKDSKMWKETVQPKLVSMNLAKEPRVIYGPNRGKPLELAKE